MNACASPSFIAPESAAWLTRSGLRPLKLAGRTLLTVLAWVVATVGWAIRYGDWYGRPRIDGRPG